MEKAVVCFSLAVRESKQLEWTMWTTGALSKVQGTNKHANMLPRRRHIKKKFHKALKQCILCVHWWHAGILKSASVRAMGRLAFGPGRADGAVAFIQVACSLCQSYTSLFPGHISKATMLVVSESGSRRKNKTQGGKPSFWAFDLGVKGISLTIHMPRSIFLGCIECSANFSELSQCVQPRRVWTVWVPLTPEKDQISGARFVHYTECQWHATELRFMFVMVVPACQQKSTDVRRPTSFDSDPSACLEACFYLPSSVENHGILRCVTPAPCASVKGFNDFQRGNRKTWVRSTI
jgi:hypothetical protein